jgi:hypothetical protein
LTSSIRKSEPEGCKCADCLHFLDDPAEFERALPGILILSSGHGETRGNQGLCRIHDKLATPNMSCDHFAPRRFA